MNERHGYRYRWGIFTVLLVSACSPVKDAGDSDLSGLASGRLWNKTDVSICFDERRSNIADFTAYQERLAAVIKREFQEEKTYFRWTGFRKCSEDANADAAILIVNNLPGPPGLMGIASQIGQFQLPPDQLSTAIFGSVTRPAVAISIGAHYKGAVATVARNLDFTIIHELGHLAGLFHEHAHPRTTCHITAERAEDRYLAFPAIDAQDAYLDYGTSYDPDSVMSYCVGESIAAGRIFDPAQSNVPSVAGLSEGDQRLLRRIYNAPNSDSEVPFAPPQPIAEDYPRWREGVGSIGYPGGSMPQYSRPPIINYPQPVPIPQEGTVPPPGFVFESVFEP